MGFQVLHLGNTLTDTREKIDIVKLNADLQEIVSRENILRAEIDKIINEIEI